MILLKRHQYPKHSLRNPASPYGRPQVQGSQLFEKGKVIPTKIKKNYSADISIIGISSFSDRRIA